MIRHIIVLLLALVPWFGARAQTNAVFADVAARRIWYPTNLLELVPPGGTNGQALVKSSSTDWDMTWATLSGDGGTGVTDHGLLTGLADDDHTNYFNVARGDARYSLLSHNQPLSTITNAGTAAAWNVPASGDANSTNVVIGTDTRLTNARTPTTHTHAESDVAGLVTDLGNKASTTHATAHKSGGSDAIKLDELAAPTDVTTLNASTSAHGLAPKLPNDATQFYNGIGAWSVPPGTGSGGGAPTNALYIVAEASTALNNERVLTNGAGLTWTDGGAGSTLTLAADFGTAAGKVTQGNDARLSQTTTRGDLNVHGASALQRLAIGPRAAFLQSDGTDPAWRGPHNTVYWFDDWVSDAAAGQTGWTAGAGGGAATVREGTADRPGHASLETSTSASAAPYLRKTSGPPLKLGGGLLLVRFAVETVTALSNGTETYTLRVGLGSSATAEPADGVYFTYSHGVNSGKWYCVNRKGSADAGLDSGVAVANATWYDLAIVVNSDASRVDFYVDSALVASETTAANVTTAAVGPFIHLIKSAGTTDRRARIDYYEFYKELTTARQ